MASLENIPIQKLLFYLPDYDDSVAVEVEGLLEELAASRNWVLHPPVYVNEGEDDFETLGGYVSLYSALPPNNLPLEVDRSHLEEVKALVSRLRYFSKAHHLAFEFELDGESVGLIEDGNLDEDLRVGLLEEWERVLSSMAAKD